MCIRDRVGGDDDIEMRRLAHQAIGHAVHQPFFHLHIRVPLSLIHISEPTRPY